MTDILYYNLSITNTNSYLNPINGPATSLQAAAITANNTQSILDNPNDYYGSVIRFSVPAFNVPLTIFRVQTPVNDINLGVQSITLQYVDNSNNQIALSDQIFWRYIPPYQAGDRVIPATGTATQSLSPYYFIYDVWQVVEQMNTAMSAALTSLKSKSGTTNISAATNPYFYYEATTNLITLYAEEIYYSQNSASIPTSGGFIKIWFNKLSETYYNGFRYLGDPLFGSSNGLDSFFVILNEFGRNKDTNIPDNLFMSQQYVSLCYWNCLKSIVLATQMNVATEITFINNPTASANQVYYSVLTDFLPDLANIGYQAGINGTTFIYNAYSLYRVFEFKQKDPLYSVNVTVLWTDTLGNYYPIELSENLIVDIKFMFIKKNKFKNFLI